MLRRINLSAAIIVLVCFFLPWEQVSCGGVRDSVSGFDLARHDHISLWLIPLLMFAVLVVGLLRRRAEKPQGQAIVALISGAATAYLMNDQRVRVHDAATIISAQLTGWFWLGLLSALALTITAVGLLVSPRRAP